MRKEIYILCLTFGSFFQNICSQNIGLLHLQGNVHSTWLNPAIMMNKNINLSLVGVGVHLGTDGPSVNDLTSKNAAGKRYIDVRNKNLNYGDRSNLYANADVHTVDLGIKIGSVGIMAGHAFRLSTNLEYPQKLLDILSYGNGSFIGQKLDISTSIDVLTFNELYVGIQYTVGNLSFGAKGKLLYGTANLNTAKNNIHFSTDQEYYQLSLQNDFELRNSGLLDYKNFDDVDIEYPSFTFDNLFYNNRGISADFGISWKMNEKFTISASALDIGSITWDYLPKKYTSDGTFTFDGVDLIEYIGDSTKISLSDTLLEKVGVQVSTGEYTTSLNARYTFACSYDFNTKWHFYGMYENNRNFNSSIHVLSLSAVRKWSIFEGGFTYSLSKNNYTTLGIFSRLKLGVFSAFLQTNSLLGLARPLAQKNIGLMVGTTLQF